MHPKRGVHLQLGYLSPCSPDSWAAQQPVLARDVASSLPFCPQRGPKLGTSPWLLLPRDGSMGWRCSSLAQPGTELFISTFLGHQLTG